MKRFFIFFCCMLLSLMGVNAVDYNNISFTNEEFYNGAITGTSTIKLSNGNIAVGFIHGGVGDLKICDSSGLNCNSTNTPVPVGVQSISIFEDITNGKIIYVTGRNDGFGHFRVYNLDGSYSGTFFNFNIGNTNYVSAVQISLTDFAIAYQDTGSSSAGRVIICKLDGSSCGTEQNVYSGGIATYLKIVKTSDNFLAIALNQGGNTQGQINIRNLDGTFAGISTSFDPNTVSYIDMIEGSDNKLKLIYRDNGDGLKGKFISCDLDGTNCGSEISFDTGTQQTQISSIKELNNKLIITRNFYDGSQWDGVVNFMNLSGGEISTNNIFDTPSSLYIDTTINSNNELIISYYNGDTTKGMFAISEKLDITSGIIFQEILLNGESIQTNQTIITNDLNFNVTVNVSSTNTNVNQTYFWYKNDTLNQTNQYATNSTIGSFYINATEEGIYNLSLFADNGEVNATAGNYSIVIDFTPPVIELNLSGEYNFYNINWTKVLNVSDDLSRTLNTELQSCVIDFSFGPSTNCTDEDYTFPLATNLSLNITATDIGGNTAVLTNIDVLINPLVLFRVQTLNSTLEDFTIGGRKDINGTVTYTTYNDGLVLGLGALTFEKAGYETQALNFELNNTGPLFNVTYNVSPATINIQIKDRDTGTLVVGPTFDLEFIASVGLIANTSTGVASITNVLFKEEGYELIVSSTNYTTESIFFYFTNKEKLDLVVYVSEEDDLSLGIVEIKVVDKFGKAIQGAIVEALQWDSSSSSYVSVSKGLTAENGRALLNIILDTKVYKFKATFEDLTTTTAQQRIPELLNGKVVTIALDVGPTTARGLFENIQYSINESFNETTYTSNILFSWTTLDGTNAKGCIKYYRVLASGTKTLLGSPECSEGNTVENLETIKILNSSYYITAEVGFEKDSLFFPIQKFRYAAAFDISEILKTTNLALYILPLIYLVAVFVGLSNPGIGAIILIIDNLLALALVPQYVDGKIVAFMYFIAALIFYAGGTRR